MPDYRVYVAGDEFEHNEAYQQGEHMTAETPLEAAEQVLATQLEEDPEWRVRDAKLLRVRVYPVNTEHEFVGALGPVKV